MANALDEQRNSVDTLETRSFEERLGLLVDREAAAQSAKRLANKLHTASLRHAVCVEDLYSNSSRGIDKSVIAHLIDGA